ncbi:MAG: hypothetical protein OXR03_21035 [Rhodospirillaceae bacterium]|nr:hypothetical protein [Rhodospirillaceae bacterium]
MLGSLLVLGFVLLSAVRDVYFGHVFQSIGFFKVVLIACTICTVFFLLVAALRGALTVLKDNLGTVLAVNITTAVAWILYFFALTHISPAAANTLYSGVGPIAIVALEAVGWRIVGRGPVRRWEAIFFVGIAVSLVMIGAGAVLDLSGMATADIRYSAAGAVLAVLAGVSLVISILYTRKLHDRGAGSDAILGTRFILIVIVAVAAEGFSDQKIWNFSVTDLAWLGLSGALLIVMPIWVLQLGIARSVPLTANIIRALGPVVVFATQLLDPRIVFSGYTLCALSFYAICVIGANLVRARAALAPA